MVTARPLLFLISVCWLCGSAAARGDAPLVPGAFNPPQDADTHQDTPQPGTPVPPPAQASPPPAPPAYLKQMPQIRAETNAAIDHCKDKYLLGEIKTHAKLVYCINPGVKAAYEHAGYPYLDLIDQINAKRLAIARQIDKKTITEAQGETELADFSEHIAEEERKRNSTPGTPVSGH